MPSSLRQTLRASRQSLTPQVREHKSLQIAQNLGNYLPFRRAQKIAFYMSTEEEVDTWPAMDLALSLGKEIYLPVINQRQWRGAALLFRGYLPGQTELRKNRFGIAEPVSSSNGSISTHALDLVCVPLVGFNAHCDRIGMGAGYYDRTFARQRYRPHHLVGLGFSCQQAEFSPAAHDVPMNAVITEDAILVRQASTG